MASCKDCINFNDICKESGAKASGTICHFFKSKDKYKKIIHAHWVWDENAIDWGIGAWICSKCFCKNNNIPHPSQMEISLNPRMYGGTRHCPNCGAQMDEVTKQ